MIICHLWDKTLNILLYFAKSEITPLHLMISHFTIHTFYWHHIEFFINRNDCSTLSNSFGDYYIVFHCISETFVCDLSKIYINTKVRWRPSWISRWPPEIFFFNLSIVFVDLQNVCLDTKIVFLAHLEDDIWINIYLMPPPLKHVFGMRGGPIKRVLKKLSTPLGCDNRSFLMAKGFI